MLSRLRGSAPLFLAYGIKYVSHDVAQRIQEKSLILIIILKALVLETILKSVSSQCARGKSSIARKPKDHFKIFKW